ncbi:MAG: MATE family efflux transporter, partial [Pseudomonadales bacterium]|nr:MATE family efflux transporter [Pseudomonadales bacterium]
GLVDTALLGHLESEQFLGAVAIGANFIGLMYWSFGFLRMGTTSLAAQQRGAEKLVSTKPGHNQAGSDSSEAILARSLLLALVLGCFIALLVPLLTDTVLRWMQASERVAPLAAEYIAIRRYSAPAVFMTFAISGWLVGTQRARAALALVLTTNIANIVLDLVFIIGLGMQSAGAAWATLLAELLGLLLGLYLLWRHSSLARLQHWQQWLNAARFRAMLRVNYHLLVRTILLLFVFNFFTAQGSAMGDDILAGNAILLQLALFSAFVLDGFAFAAEALCGEAYGARSWAALQQITRRCFYWSGYTALAFAIVYALTGDLLIGLLSDVAVVVTAASPYKGWLVALTLCSFVAYIMDGICIGCGKTKAMHYAMWFSTTVVFLPAWWLSQAWGNHGLWLAFLLFNTARGASLAFYWQRARPGG